MEVEEGKSQATMWERKRYALESQLEQVHLKLESVGWKGSWDALIVWLNVCDSCIWDVKRMVILVVIRVMRIV